MTKLTRDLADELKIGRDISCCMDEVGCLSEASNACCPKTKKTL